MLIIGAGWGVKPAKTLNLNKSVKITIIEKEKTLNLAPYQIGYRSN